MMFDSKVVIVLFAVLGVIAYVYGDDVAMTTNKDVQLQDTAKRAIKISCRCWIGWRGSESTKYTYFGIIRKFGLFTLNKQGKCSSSCSTKCAPVLLQKSFLCNKIRKNYNYKQNKVGCFSKVGAVDLPGNLWDFDGVPHKLCCKRYMKSCSSVYGSGYWYSSSKKMCLKKLITGCIPMVTPNEKKPPVCCFWGNTYSCQHPKYGTKSYSC